MILKNWLKQIDPLTDIIIWGSNDDEEPLFEGSVLDIPWLLVNFPIGRVNKDADEPIYISTHTKNNGVISPLIVVNVIEK